MPVCIDRAFLDLPVERQGLFPGILLPAYETPDMASQSMVGSHGNHRASVRRQRNFVSVVLYIFHYW
jgi:hypothetical protein